ncbi:MAG: amidohydrolase family protein, partial [Deltaproteobacteria bacterium]
MGNSLVFINANIITMNHAHPRARAMAVRQGRIAAVGTREAVQPFEDGAMVIDLNGKTVLPGLIDSHVHFTSTGIKAMAIDFSPV